MGSEMCIRDSCNLLSLTVGVALIDIIKIFEFVLPDDNLYATSGSLTYLVSAFFVAYFVIQNKNPR